MRLIDFLDKYDVSKKDRGLAIAVYGENKIQSEEEWQQKLHKSIRLKERKIEKKVEAQPAPAKAKQEKEKTK